MSQSFPYYLRIERKRSGFTQDELAYLLGFRVASAVSRFERGEREPDLRTAFAYQILFDRPADQLFPVTHADARRLVAGRAADIAGRLRQAEQDNRTAYKLQRLEALMAGEAAA